MEIKSFKHRLHEIIFETDTPFGKAFDLGLLLAILISVLAVIVESVKSIEQDFGTIIKYVEWGFTILFTIEYVARIWVIKKSWSYIFSFLGLVDLLSILPTYLSVFIVGTQSLLIIRVLRLLRVFRILKLARFVNAAKMLSQALKASWAKITVFLWTIFAIVIIMGTVMYMIEGSENGFTSIPRSIYWAIVTLTTVGYGDIAPATVLGQALASMLMILGYAIIAVPTGIVTTEMVKANKNKTDDLNTQNCSSCASDYHDDDAVYCKFCGEKLNS